PGISFDAHVRVDNDRGGQSRWIAIDWPPEEGVGMRTAGGLEARIGERLLYNPAESAYLLGISRGTFLREVARGAIKTVKIRAATRVSAAELNRYVEALQK